MNVGCGFHRDASQKSVLTELCAGKLLAGEKHKSNIGVEMLLQDSRIDVHKGNPAFYALEEGNIEALQMLLHHESFDINIEYKHGTCPRIAIHAVCLWKTLNSRNKEAVRMLIYVTGKCFTLVIQRPFARSS